ncbi:UNVERIFIED_CONTAM: hypothetical protein POZ17_19735 [Ralstonia mannitolilytica]
MEAKELRIGNILNAVVSNGVETFTFNEIVVHELTKDGMKDEKGFRFPYDTLVGIPLNEWWLLKFGFTQDGDEYSKDRFTFRINQRSLIIEGFEYDYNGILIGTEDLHVHDLQNLYFAIKRDELLIID